MLTSYHVISNIVNNSGNFIDDDIRPYITFKYSYKGNKGFDTTEIYYEVDKVYVNQKLDMALLQFEIGIKLNYSKIVTREMVVGEEIYISANPNNSYRTLVSGIISNKDRYANNNPIWQISGGVINGASGGGAFTRDGKLIGIVQAVDTQKTSLYKSVYDKDGNIIGKKYLTYSIPYMGYFSPPETMRKFLLSTKLKHKFKYLK